METKKSKNIVVVGSCMMDFVSYAPRLPKPGETLHGHKFQINCGGKGANQCVAAAKLGGRTSLIAKVGNDIWGKQYLQNLKDNQIETAHFELIPNTTTGIAQITVSDSGENQIVIIAGANNYLTPNDIILAKETISSASVLVLQLETSVEVALKTLELTKGKTLISILNGAPAIENCPSELLKLPTIFCVNETEAEIFANEPINTNDLNSAKNVAKKLITNNNCQNVIITVGDKGAIYCGTETNFEPKHLPTKQAEKVVDTTGAGDAFIGALAYVLANVENYTIIKAIECANIYATQSVQVAGTQSSFSGFEAIEDHLSNLI